MFTGRCDEPQAPAHFGGPFGQNLAFSWTDNEQFMVLPLCNYFLLDETYILPMLKSSLKLEYAFPNNEYKYFYFVNQGQQQ